MLRVRDHDDLERLPVLDPGNRDLIVQCLAASEERMRPAEPDQIIKALTPLAAIPQWQTTAADEQFKLAVFVEGLSPFPKWAIDRAVKAWVTTSRKRPAPADLITAAQAERAKVAHRVWIMRNWLERRRCADTVSDEPVAPMADHEIRVIREKAVGLWPILRRMGLANGSFTPEALERIEGPGDGQAVTNHGE